MIEVKRDGGWGWLVVFCVLCSQTILGGVCLSGGLFYVIFMNALGSSPVETSWLCSLPITLWFIASPIGSFLTNRYGFRVCAFTGGIIAALGICLGYFAKDIGVLFFTHGILTGLGMGLNYTGCMTALNIYFDKYKTIVTGISSIGHNFGMIIYAQFIVFMERKYGWRGMMLLQGAVTFHMCAFACALLPLTVHDTTKRSTNQNVGIKKDEKVEKKLINLTVLRKSSFLFFCASNIFINFAQGVYILHLPSYSRYAGFTDRDFGTVLMVYGICNVVGKVVYSLLGQHPKIDTTFLYTVSLTATGISILLMPVFLTKVGMLVLTGLVGFFYCVTGALLHAVIYRIVGFERFADGIGMSMPFKATGNLIGGPFAGFLFATTGNYATSFYLAGAGMIFGSVLMIQPILYHRKMKRNDKHKDLYTVCEIDVNDREIGNEAVNGTTVQSKLIYDISKINRNGKLLPDNIATETDSYGTTVTDSLLKQ